MQTIQQVRRRLVDELGLDPGAGLDTLEAAILRQDPALDIDSPRERASDVCPYPGLMPYDVVDDEVFFGRERDIAACLERLAQERVLAVLGPSGSGAGLDNRIAVAVAGHRPTEIHNSWDFDYGGEEWVRLDLEAGRILTRGRPGSPPARDGTVALWDGRTGGPLGSVVLPERSISAAQFASNGTTVVIGTYTDALYEWDTSSTRAIEFACALAGRDFTEAEWSRLFGERPYRSTCPGP